MSAPEQQPPPRTRSRRRQEKSAWEQRLAFFRRSVVIDGICPVLGVGIIVYQTDIQSGLLPPYIVAAGLIGLPGVARLAGFLGGGK